MKVYYKYQLDVVEPHAIMKFHKLETMIDYINSFKHGLRIELKDMIPYIVKGHMRYLGKYYRTQKGKIRVVF